MFIYVSSYKALSQGAKLWIVPFEPNHFWFKKINWQLRFLLCPPSSAPLPKNSVLVSVERVFPARQILCLLKGKEDWVISCHRYWKLLGKPSLRIFLPEGMDSDILSAKWPEEKSHDILSCVSAKAGALPEIRLGNSGG